MTPTEKYTVEWWASLPPERVGYETEKLVESLFADWNRRQSFAWHRLPDAKAGRGRIKAQPADYIFRSHQFGGFIEVKALKHAYRLPASRLTQLPTLHKWTMAGSAAMVLIHHYIQHNWRVVSAGDLDTGVPSWDLRHYPTYLHMREALLSTGFFDDQI